MEGETLHTENFDIRKRNELELGVIAWAAQHGRVSDDIWVEKYAVAFEELYDASDIAERFEKMQDRNPEELLALYEWIQDSLEKMAKGRE